MSAYLAAIWWSLQAVSNLVHKIATCRASSCSFGVFGKLNPPSKSSTFSPIISITVGFATLEKLLFTAPSSGQWIFRPELAARTAKELQERKEKYERIQKEQIEELERIQRYRKLAEHSHIANCEIAQRV